MMNTIRTRHCYIHSLIHTHMLPGLQSAYRARHSTETAVLRVLADIRGAVDIEDIGERRPCDAFDTDNHTTLLHHLEVSYGVSDTVHRWFISYLSGRSIAVCSLCVNIIASKGRPVRCPAMVGLGTDPLRAVYSRPDRSS